LAGFSRLGGLLGLLDGLVRGLLGVLGRALRVLGCLGGRRLGSLDLLLDLGVERLGVVEPTSPDASSPAESPSPSPSPSVSVSAAAGGDGDGGRGAPLVMEVMAVLMVPSALNTAPRQASAPRTRTIFGMIW
jgi:hypothetical protein